MERLIHSKSAAIYSEVADVYTRNVRGVVKSHQQMIEDYKTIKEELTEGKALIQPIRAIVIRTPDANLKNHIEKVAMTMGGVVLYKQDHRGTILAIDRMETVEYEQVNRPVGYMIGVKDELAPHLHRIGYSLCRPEDYYKYEKELGICLAYNNLHLDQEYEAHADINFKYRNKLAIRCLDSGNRCADGYTTYIFPDSPAMQYDRFVDRCTTYFRG